jgi:hypothetical protein
MRLKQPQTGYTGSHRPNMTQYICFLVNQWWLLSNIYMGLQSKSQCAINHLLWSCCSPKSNDVA